MKLGKSNIEVFIEMGRGKQVAKLYSKQRKRKKKCLDYVVVTLALTVLLCPGSILFCYQNPRELLGDFEQENQ